MVIATKIIFLFILSSIVIGCDNKSKEFDDLCQGWGGETALSYKIYNKLKDNQFIRYISIKEGSDRGFYTFYFLGQTIKKGIFIYSNGVELVSGTVPLSKVDNVFSILPENIQTLKNYTGSGDVWFYLSCAYMKIKIQNQSKILSFQDYVLKTTELEMSEKGIKTMIEIKNYIDDELIKSTNKKLVNQKTVKVELIPTLSSMELKAIELRKSNDQIFYEIP